MFRITIADTQQQFECAPDDTIVRAALRAGLGMPYECNVGSCGTCKLELVSGAVVPNWPQAPALTERDRARRRVLGCQSRPTADCTIKARLAEQYQSGCQPQRFKATLSGYRELTHDIREFRFQLDVAVNFLLDNTRCCTFPEPTRRGRIRCPTSRKAMAAGVFRSSGCRAAPALLSCLNRCAQATH
jgi:toluene monooxygenase electron transfer component